MVFSQTLRGDYYYGAEVIGCDFVPLFDSCGIDLFIFVVARYVCDVSGSYYETYGH